MCFYWIWLWMVIGLIICGGRLKAKCSGEGTAERNMEPDIICLVCVQEIPW